MTPRLGLSSACAPDATAVELAGLVRTGGGVGVDLRSGRGHGWESHGLTAGLAAVRAAGVEVAFVGTSWQLGAGDDWDTAAYADLPIRVFCAAEPDRALMSEQVSAAHQHRIELLVETHRPGPGAAPLAEIVAVHRLGVVLDNRGLTQLGDPVPAAARLLAPYVRAVQLKGTDGPRHAPLRAADLDLLALLADAGAPVRDVTVESRAGTPLDDLALIAGFYRMGG